MRLSTFSWREILTKLGFAYHAATPPRRRTRRLGLEKLASRKTLASDLQIVELDDLATEYSDVADESGGEQPTDDALATNSAVMPVTDCERLDVNADGYVSARDALLIANGLSTADADSAVGKSQEFHK